MLQIKMRSLRRTENKLNSSFKMHWTNAGIGQITIFHKKKGDAVSACPHAIAADRYSKSREILQGVLTQRQITSYDKRLTKKELLT